MEKDKSASPDDVRAANLERMRLNQRRSRARKKEYVRDLEAKTRDFEAQQVKASVELQHAARRVNDENESLKTEVKRLQDENRELKRIMSSHFQSCQIDNSAYSPAYASLSPSEEIPISTERHNSIGSTWQYPMQRTLLSASHTPFADSGYASTSSRSPGSNLSQPMDPAINGVQPSESYSGEW